VKPRGPLHLAADVRDLQIVDCDGACCGIVDDIEFEGGPAKKLRLKAILVGPGAYRGRLPAWLAWLVSRLAGERVVRIPWQEVETIGSVVKLKRTARTLGLDAAERRARAWLPGGSDDALV
jgi:sporulation protein YlmC with PRC-barrel domain